MGRVLSRLAPSAAGREMHTHLTTAIKAVHKALAVCAKAGRASRKADLGPSFAEQQHRLGRALRLMVGIGHLGREDEPDLTQEARALCSWLEGRERAAGVRRPSRRGAEYQARLQQVATFLTEASLPFEAEEAPIRARVRAEMEEAPRPLIDPTVPRVS